MVVFKAHGNSPSPSRPEFLRERLLLLLLLLLLVLRADAAGTYYKIAKNMKYNKALTTL
jgi:hypothetical protein